MWHLESTFFVPSVDSPTDNSTDQVSLRADSPSSEHTSPRPVHSPSACPEPLCTIPTTPPMQSDESGSAPGEMLVAVATDLPAGPPVDDFTMVPRPEAAPSIDSAHLQVCAHLSAALNALSQLDGD